MQQEERPRGPSSCLVKEIIQPVRSTHYYWRSIRDVQYDPIFKTVIPLVLATCDRMTLKGKEDLHAPSRDCGSRKLRAD